MNKDPEYAGFQTSHMAHTERLGWVALGLLFVALMVALSGCKPAEPASSGPRAGVSSASLVTILRVQRATPGSALETGSFRDRYVAHCGAFAVERLGRVQLATAAHCVYEHDVWRYEEPSGWGHGLARVQFLDEARDLAYLDPADAEGLDPLQIGPPPSAGERVRAFSPVYDQTAFGTVQADYGNGWYETSQTIVYGWSGSPEIDSYGRAVAVVAKCPATGDQCTPGRALVSALAP